MAYQSLYRRYRSQRFDELKGQDHVSLALRNAVRDERVAHAYLFSGPRGTGKTSSARILAKALNCEKAIDGEPDDTCQSCIDITAGSSLDVFELDAASNNGVEAMRDLVSRAALGTPGRWKVYIVDEVHMLSTAASNALLKTLEEPPGHVIFVLATTDPQKVLPTIRSRTQHFEFRLVPYDVIVEHLRWVASDAGLEVDDATIEAAARKGNGSMRDALSALDQAAVGGGLDDHRASTDELIEALCDQDAGRAIAGVAERVTAGIDARQLTRDLLDELRAVFLSLMARQLVDRPEAELEAISARAHRLGPATTVRAMELLGQALVDMREAPDPRVLLEVALVRLCHPDADTSVDALVQRIERLERAVAAGGGGGGGGGERTAVPSGQVRTAPAVGASRQATPSAEEPSTVETAPAVAPVRRPSAKASSEPMPSRDDLTLAWGDHVLAHLPAGARALYKSGRFVDVEGDAAIYALPNAMHRDRCESKRVEVEGVLESHFGRPIGLRLVVADEAAAPTSTVESGPPIAGVASAFDHVMQAFEGAEVVEE
jgi:DNA polymerase-3 subunit gamma/tau